jgi:hypothetical protein
LGKRIGFSESLSGLENGREIRRGDNLKNMKNKLPENSLFNISSLVFNLENSKEEVLHNYSCFFNPSLEALCIMIDDGTKYSDLSKEIVMNLMDFTQKMQIKNIILLLERKNRDYVKILQGMMTIGFQNDSSLKITKVGGKDYKVLKMQIKLQPEEIEEIAF